MNIVESSIKKSDSQMEIMDTTKSESFDLI